MLRLMHDLVEAQCQFVIATHSPILMAYPRATIYQLSNDGACVVRYEDTEHYLVTRDFVANHRRYLQQRLGDVAASGEPESPPPREDMRWSS